MPLASQAYYGGRAAIKENIMKITDLISRYPILAPCADSIEKAAELLYTRTTAGGKILLCGNGGSAADCDHIVGELMKGFLSRRPLSETDKARFAETESSVRSARLAESLQYAIPAISLCAHSAVLTAFVNDVEPDDVFAQLMYGYGTERDTAFCLSTSGNSKNVVNAALAAKARGMAVISMTGQKAAELDKFSDVVIKVPEIETYKIQELHLPVYHYLCAVLEERFFG